MLSSWRQTSKTTIWNAHLGLKLPDKSVAVQLTVVIPMGKTEPDGGSHATLPIPQLSETLPFAIEGVAYVTALLPSPGLAVTAVTSAGQKIVGEVLSTTDTVAMHSVIAPLLSVTVSVTDVVPSGYGPEGD